ncbi:DUF2076 domain-containing protein [Tunturiibacter gelidiferens]
MTPQEQDMIGGLIDRIQKTQLTEKDTDAEQMLQQGLGRNPDALYILAQTVLVQKYALEQAQAQLTQAKAQIEQMQQHPEPKHATSFLGSLLGRNEEPVPPPPPPPQQAYSQQGGPAYPPYAPVGAGMVLLRCNMGLHRLNMVLRRAAGLCVARCRPLLVLQRARWRSRAWSRLCMDSGMRGLRRRPGIGRLRWRAASDRGDRQ